VYPFASPPGNGCLRHGCFDACGGGQALGVVVESSTGYNRRVPANFTRRRDLFLDAGYADADAVIGDLQAEVARLGLAAQVDSPGPAAQDWARRVLSERVRPLPPEQRRFASLVPEWLASRSGDLATVLWLARATYESSLDSSGLLLAIWDALLDTGRSREALAYARFMLDLRFDWTELYRDPRIAYAFLDHREPNPLVWHVLHELGEREREVRLLELGCGVGNDAMGFCRHAATTSYVGIDISPEAIQRFQERIGTSPPAFAPRLVVGDFVSALARDASLSEGVNLIYSYSSLHYFSSSELRDLYEVTRRILGADGRRGYFAFGIKGAGSVWDGQGLPLYRPDVWVNHDGQSRWFPSREVLIRQLHEAGFEILFHSRHDHWGYSELGQRDLFHYVLCTPRK